MRKNLEELLKIAKLADDANRPAEVVEVLKVAASCAHLTSVSVRLRFAENLRIIGRLTEAEGVLSSITDISKEKEWLLNIHKGQIYIDRKDFQAAVQCFTQAVEKNPKSTVPFIYLANAYISSQQQGKAVDVLLRGLQAQGDLDEVYLNLGYCYRTIGEYLLAKESFLKALEVDGSCQEAVDALSDVNSVVRFFQEIEPDTSR